MSHQNHAVWIWQSLPHVLIWTALLLQVVVMGYGGGFTHIQPALPLMVALIWCWEWRSSGIILSLLLAGTCLDLLSAMPLGWHGLLWVGVYLIAPRLVYQFAQDEPFALRWLTCAGALAVLIFAEYLLCLAYSLSPPTILSMVFRLLIMLLLLPAISWIVHVYKKASYSKLWMWLPEELRISVR